MPELLTFVILADYSSASMILADYSSASMILADYSSASTPHLCDAGRLLLYARPQPLLGERHLRLEAVPAAGRGVEQRLRLVRQLLAVLGQQQHGPVHRRELVVHLGLLGRHLGERRRERERERNVLFNEALNTVYLRLYGVRHMVKDHSDSEKGNPLPPHGLLLSISSKGSFICTIPHTRAFVKPVMEHWLEREIA